MKILVTIQFEQEVTSRLGADLNTLHNNIAQAISALFTSDYGEPKLLLCDVQRGGSGVTHDTAN